MRAVVYKGTRDVLDSAMRQMLTGTSTIATQAGQR
jgi:hypothetical protein